MSDVSWNQIEEAVMPVYWAIYNNVGKNQASRWMDEAVLTTPQLRLEHNARCLRFNLSHIPCPINVQAALRGEETVVGYTKDSRQRLEFLAEMGVETCSAFVSARDLYMGILAASPDQCEQFISSSYSYSEGWQHHISYNGARWSFSTPRD